MFMFTTIQCTLIYDDDDDDDSSTLFTCLILLISEMLGQGYNFIFLRRAGTSECVFCASGQRNLLVSKFKL